MLDKNWNRSIQSYEVIILVGDLMLDRKENSKTLSPCSITG
jgi:hypothetical protein